MIAFRFQDLGSQIGVGFNIHIQTQYGGNHSAGHQPNFIQINTHAPKCLFFLAAALM